MRMFELQTSTAIVVGGYLVTIDGQQRFDPGLGLLPEMDVLDAVQTWRTLKLKTRPWSVNGKH